MRFIKDGDFEYYSDEPSSIYVDRNTLSQVDEREKVNPINPQTVFGLIILGCFFLTVFTSQPQRQSNPIIINNNIIRGR